MLDKSITLGELAGMLDAELRGDANVVVNGVAPLEIASSEQITFLSNSKLAKQLDSSAAAAVVLRADVAEDYEGAHVLVVSDPYLAYAKMSQIFDPRPSRTVGIHPSAVIAESAKISASASIGANCVIGDNVVVGDHCEIYPGTVISENSCVGARGLIHANVTIYSNVRIGTDAVIHSGAVIGSDGFGFAPTSEGWVKIHQIGGVVIGDRVEIGASTAIDRGAMGDTLIADGVIIDNLVHLAHNVEIGENTALAGCVGIAGSTKIGKNCMLAGAVKVNGHISIADNCVFHGGTIVTKSIEASGTFASATPIQDVGKWRRTSVRYSQLDDIASRLKKLEKSKD